MKRNNPKVRPFPTAEPVDPLERGLPANVDCERYVLGAVLLNDSLYRHVAASLQPADFSLEKHRRIFARMDDLAERGERIDPGTLVNELMGAGELPAK